MKLNILIVLLILSAFVHGQSVIKIDLLPGEKVWSGIIKDGHKLPYASGYKYDFYANHAESP